MENNKPMTAEEYMKYISDSNGWGKHSPLTGGYDVPTWMEMYHKHMSQSAQQQPQGSELPSEQLINDKDELITIDDAVNFHLWIGANGWVFYSRENKFRRPSEITGSYVQPKTYMELYKLFKSKQKGEGEMSSKQQTAVEWLRKEYESSGFLTDSDFIGAMEIFQEQIVNAHLAGQRFASDNDNPDSEEYYTQTYGGEQ